MDIDPVLRSDLFSVRGNVILSGNGTLPYLMLNATLCQGKASVASTKYLLLKIDPNRDYSFEIAKNIDLQPGEYICTLEASGPGGALARESRKCSLEQDQAESISSEIPSGILISSSEARALYTARGLFGYESTEIQRGSRSREEEDKIAAKEVENVDEPGGLASFDPEADVAQESADQPDGGKVPSSSDSEDENESDVGAAGMDSVYGATVAIAGLNKTLDMAEEEPEGQLVASSTSKKYHRPDCRYAQKIKPENRVNFRNENEAKSQGYIPCKSCNP